MRWTGAHTWERKAERRRMRHMGSQQPRLKTSSIAVEQQCNSKVMSATRHLAFPRWGGGGLTSARQFEVHKSKAVMEL